MSEKIKKMLITYVDHRSEMVNSMCDGDMEEANECRLLMEEAEQAILAEFAKLNAVREKLVEACKGVLSQPSGCSCEISNEEVDAWSAVSEALAANAELEGK